MKRNVLYPLLVLCLIGGLVYVLLVARKQQPDLLDQPPTGNTSYNQIGAIPPPAGYARKTLPEQSFGYFLRQFPLKKDNTIYYYDGQVRNNQNGHFAVLDMTVGNRDLLQCADVVMKLRMLYLKTQRKQMLFYDNEGGEYALSHPYDKLEQYMNRVFAMCGSMSLSKQLRAKSMRDIAIGDVFIKGGFPGHAQMVVDVVENDRGHRCFMLAQGFMPAQSPHIVRNLNNNRSPWFDVRETTIASPDYSFTSDQLKTW